MAVPIILGGIATVAGVAGLAKGTKVVVDNINANKTNESANQIVKNAEKRLESRQKVTQQSLERLGKTKVGILRNVVKDFLKVFGQIKNVDFQHDGRLGNLALKDFDVADFTMLKQELSFMESFIFAGGLTGGALVAFGAYNNVALLRVTSATAIKTLSGMTAMNATLAWLGGGTLVVSSILNMAVSGPALLITTWYMGAKAQTKLNNAKTNLAQAQAFKDDMESVIAMIGGIGKLAILLNGLFRIVEKEAQKTLGELESVIKIQGIDYSQYDEEAKLCVMKNVKIMQLIKAMLDIAILDEEGNVLGDAESNIFKAKQIIDNNYQGRIA